VRGRSRRVDSGIFPNPISVCLWPVACTALSTVAFVTHHPSPVRYDTLPLLIRILVSD